MSQITSYIKTNEQLLKITPLLMAEKILFVDTEFVRKSTYWPILGLVQIATNDAVYIIDGVTVDMILLKPVFQNPEIQKFFYSAKQDLEILYYLYKELPKNVQDLQLAYTFAGQGGHVGLERAVNQVLDIEMDKQSQFSDWVQRPLTPEQLDYAAEDAVCIRNLYAPIMAMLRESGHYNWYAYYTNQLFTNDKLFDNTDKAVRRLRFKLQNPFAFHMLDALSIEREILADQHNKPRQHIMPDRVLEGIAERNPASFDDFKAVVFDKKLHNKPLRYNAEITKQLYHTFLTAKEELSLLDKESSEKLMKERLDIIEFSAHEEKKIQEIKDTVTKLAEETQIPVHYLMPTTIDFYRHFRETETFSKFPWSTDTII